MARFMDLEAKPDYTRDQESLSLHRKLLIISTFFYEFEMFTIYTKDKIKLDPLKVLQLPQFYDFTWCPCGFVADKFVNLRSHFKM